MTRQKDQGQHKAAKPPWAARCSSLQPQRGRAACKLDRVAFARLGRPKRNLRSVAKAEFESVTLLTEVKHLRGKQHPLTAAGLQAKHRNSL